MDKQSSVLGNRRWCRSVSVLKLGKQSL